MILTTKFIATRVLISKLYLALHVFKVVAKKPLTAQSFGFGYNTLII